MNIGKIPGDFFVHLGSPFVRLLEDIPYRFFLIGRQMQPRGHFFDPAFGESGMFAPPEMMRVVVLPRHSAGHTQAVHDDEKNDGLQFAAHESAPTTTADSSAAPAPASATCSA